MRSPLGQIGSTALLFRRNEGRRFWAVLLTGLCILASLSCQHLKTENPDSFYAEAVPPRRQELRWSNGKAPRSLDPALAASPPETDIIRAIYEGLTDLDPKTLREVPAVAEKWIVSPDNRTWIFQLRKDAKWANGEPVTAVDFVRSWKRFAELGDKAPNRNLFENIVGMHQKTAARATTPLASDQLKESSISREPGAVLAAPRRGQRGEPDIVPDKGRNNTRPETVDSNPKSSNEAEKEKLGIEAIGDRDLKVTLITPDNDFPKLVANPAFRPVYGEGKNLDKEGLDADIVTNGPFRISSIDTNGISLVRSDKYWNRGAVNLESVKFVPAQSAERALDSYRAGDVDAVTNVDLEPLAQKLLSPFGDFRQATHNALNFYEINAARAPFSDRRVREALAISIERNRLTENEMKGATEPAFHFLPFNTNSFTKLSQDADRARKLLVSAGFPDGDGFPTIRLVVNRNDTQLRIARSVVRMWKQNLNIAAEIVIKETSEMEAVRTSGDFDILRRGVVFPTVDKKASFAALFPDDERKGPNEPEHRPGTDNKQVAVQNAHEQRPNGPSDSVDTQSSASAVTTDPATEIADDAALFDFRLIPLYFPVSYGLVKPYVQGFELNGLDAPSLKDVRIDSDWQPASTN